MAEATVVHLSPTLTRLVHPVSESATALGVSVGTLWRMIAAGHIRAVRISGRTLIPTSEIERLVDPDRNPMGSRHA